MIEKTLVIIKPDAIQRNLVGEIITRFDRKGLHLVGTKMMQLTDDILEKHYAHHKDRPFFGNLTSFMKSSPCVLMVWEGIGAVNSVRLLAGITKAREAAPGTIRGDFALSQQFNLIHASDSPESAQKEIALFFSKDEIFAYQKVDFAFTHAEDERNVRPDSLSL